ncbi:MAG: ferritin-like domain-containing protein [Methylobacter sp.]|uniref:Ferritin-like domain-containing protein n=1 Tax=Candidatus Methylobacter titanis TaxID=3053457 RepID=A0AA43Q7K5_9GAMM|nr:ferritin-like domain-containing protein [Candidatus Methylobacter titanis]MDI1293588.1 ferritin-like domain-containing protein [Candidatus Methylobacter titanis]
MKNLFDFAEAFFCQANVDEKLALTHQAWQTYIAKELTFTSGRPVLPIDRVIFPARPELLAPRQMPRRKLTTTAGVAAFFHAIAHVEFVAIYLAWDILYRFRGMPDQFYQDWLRVADEEAQHFELIRMHLRAIEIEYGDLPAHSGLWDHAKDTADDLLGRLAMVPRCMEARGLDVTPALIEKFRILGDDASVAILTRILTDEVRHVERGSYWFKFVCQQRGFEAEAKYCELIDQYYIGGKPKGPFNRELRKIAGFSDAEIDWLES